METSTTTIILAIGAWMTLLGLVAIVGGLLHYRRERLLTHQERMKALELGRELPDDAATARIKAAFGDDKSDDKAESRSLARTCFSTALWVGFWGFLAASQGGWANTGIAIAIAGSAGAIGVTAMICGAILGMRESPASPTAVAAKSVVESDAFDVVSSRG